MYLKFKNCDMPLIPIKTFILLLKHYYLVLEKKITTSLKSTPNASSINRFRFIFATDHKTKYEKYKSTINIKI